MATESALRTRKTAPKVLRARAQVGDLAQNLERVPLLLERIVLGSAGAVDVQVARLQLDRLALARRGDELAFDADAGAGGDAAATTSAAGPRPLRSRPGDRPERSRRSAG